MTLTIGTDAYYSLDDTRAYWAALGDTAWAALDDAAAEVLIRKATNWIDRSFEFIGDKATGTQRLKWPRQYAEVEGFALDAATIPWQVGEATAQVADLYRLGTFDLEGIVTNDSASINKTKVDVIEVGYDTSKRLQGGAILSNVIEVLRPVTRGNSGGLKRA